MTTNGLCALVFVPPSSRRRLRRKLLPGKLGTVGMLRHLVCRQCLVGAYDVFVPCDEPRRGANRRIFRVLPVCPMIIPGRLCSLTNSTSCHEGCSKLLPVGPRGGCCTYVVELSQKCHAEGCRSRKETQRAFFIVASSVGKECAREREVVAQQIAFVPLLAQIMHTRSPRNLFQKKDTYISWRRGLQFAFVPLFEQ